MKNITYSLLLLLLQIGAHAQKIVEKHTEVSPGTFISMDFQISDSIRIITWNKPDFYVKSSINVNDNKNNDDYIIDVSSSGTHVNLRGKLDFKGKNNRNCENCCCNCTTEIFHEVYIPENADFSVETINGNIIITGKTAEVRAHSISGYIDFAVAADRKADLKLSTITGTMFSNVDLNEGARKMHHVGGGSLTAQLNGGGGKSIDLQTISGNIFFRKAGS